MTHDAVNQDGIEMINSDLQSNWKDSIYRQREELARMLRDPIERVAELLHAVWPDKQQMEDVLLHGFSSIPYCTSLYVLDKNAVQLTENIGHAGVTPGHYNRDRSQRPYAGAAMGFCYRMSISVLRRIALPHRAQDHPSGRFGARLSRC
jgi:hypothetical protein